MLVIWNFNSSEEWLAKELVRSPGSWKEHAFNGTANWPPLPKGGRGSISANSIKQTAVFAPASCPLVNPLPQSVVAHVPTALRCRSAFNRKVAIMSASSMNRSYSRVSSGESCPSLAFWASASSRVLEVSSSFNPARARTLVRSRHLAADSNKLSSKSTTLELCSMN